MKNTHTVKNFNKCIRELIYAESVEAANCYREYLYNTFKATDTQINRAMKQRVINDTSERECNMIFNVLRQEKNHGLNVDKKSRCVVVFGRKTRIFNY